MLIKATTDTGTVGIQGKEYPIKGGMVDVPEEHVRDLIEICGFVVVPQDIHPAPAGMSNKAKKGR